MSQTRSALPGISPSRAVVFSSLNLHSAGECEGHCSLPMHRYLFNQMPPVVSVEFGNAIRQGFYLGDEALSLLGLRLLLAKGFLGGGQYLLRFFIPGKHLIVTPLVIVLILCHAGVLIDELLDKLRRYIPLVFQPGDFHFQSFGVSKVCLYLSKVGDDLPADAQQLVHSLDEALLDFLLRQVRGLAAMPVELAVAQEPPTTDLLIIDDNAAKKTAKFLGLHVTGTLGVLLKAKRMGLVEGIAPLIEDLCKNGFYVDETVKAMALKQASENP